jgi:hypothetical protein
MQGTHQRQISVQAREANIVQSSPRRMRSKVTENVEKPAEKLRSTSGATNAYGMDKSTR